MCWKDCDDLAEDTGKFLLIEKSWNVSGARGWQEWVSRKRGDYNALLSIGFGEAGGRLVHDIVELLVKVVVLAMMMVLLNVLVQGGLMALMVIDGGMQELTETINKGWGRGRR